MATFLLKMLAFALLFGVAVWVAFAAIGVVEPLWLAIVFGFLVLSLALYAAWRFAKWDEARLVASIDETD